MNEMKTLTINGKTYTVADPDAGTASIDDTAVGGDAWSGKHIADTLAPALTESGAVVTCQPVTGYPLSVVSCIEPVQAGEGDPSPENVRPITGHTAAALWRGGKNYFNIGNVISNTYSFVVNNGDGTLTINTDSSSAGVIANSPSKLKDFAPGLKAGRTYVLSAVTSGQKYIYLSQVAVAWRFGEAKTVTDEMLNSSVYWYANGVSTTAVISNIQIEEGNTATAYEPYRGESFTLDLGQTVYGGSLDWQTGVLTVDRGCKSITEIGEAAFQTNNMVHFGLTNALFDGKVSRISCSHYLCGVYNSAYPDNYAYQANAVTVVARDTAHFTALEAVNAYLAAQAAAGTPVQLCYELAAPVTVQLTPREILALSGTNVLYSDTGDTALEGRADPNAVIEKLTNAIIALGGNI